MQATCTTPRRRHFKNHVPVLYVQYIHTRFFHGTMYCEYKRSLRDAVCGTFESSVASYGVYRHMRPYVSGGEDKSIGFQGPQRLAPCVGPKTERQTAATVSSSTWSSIASILSFRPSAHSFSNPDCQRHREKKYICKTIVIAYPPRSASPRRMVRYLARRIWICTCLLYWG